MFRTLAPMLLLRAAVLSVLLVPLGAARAASPTTVSDGFRSVPPPPASPAIAMLWVQDGRVTAADVVQLQAALAAARSSALADATAASNDRAPASASDPATVKLAVEGYQAYLSANQGPKAPAAMLGGRVQWLAKRFSGLRKRVEGTDRIEEVREQELAAYRALFTDWQSQRAPFVAKAQTELAAAGDPASIRSPENRAAVQRYRAAMIEETEVLLGLTRYAVERAAGLPTAEPSSVTPSATTLWDLMSDARKTPP